MISVSEQRPSQYIKPAFTIQEVYFKIEQLIKMRKVTSSHFVMLILSCKHWQSLRYPQMSPFSEVFPSVCFLEHLSACLLSFSPQEPLPVCLLPPWWLLLGCQGQQFWPCLCVCPGVRTAYDWHGVTRGLLPHGFTL